MLAGLEGITAGEIRIGDRVVNYVAPKERDIAMVFQNYALYPHLTFRDNIGFGLKLRKVPKEEIERRVREAAAILGISEFLDRKPRALSGGQRQTKGEFSRGGGWPVWASEPGDEGRHFTGAAVHARQHSERGGAVAGLEGGPRPFHGSGQMSPVRQGAIFGRGRLAGAGE